MPVKNRNLYRLTRLILFKFPYILQFFAKFKKAEKRILIIKIDAIGDYILFRNFLTEIKTSKKYQQYEIDLIGNLLWQDVALLYDHSLINKFYFINTISLYHEPVQVLKLSWKIFCRNYEIALQPSFTRTFINDGLAALSAAKHIIGFKGDFEATIPKIKNKTDLFYNQLIQLPSAIYFEFERTRFFFETVLQKRITLKGPFLPAKTTTQNYIAICLGAGNYKRSWEAVNFLELIQLILKNTTYDIQLSGGPDTVSDASFIDKKLASSRVKNLTGKTTIPDFIDTIANSALVICNETAAVHIASACNKKVISILGGGHFKRFAPYPANYINKPTFVFEEIHCYNCNWICKFKTATEEPFPCISIIKLEYVWKEVKQLLHIG